MDADRRITILTALPDEAQGVRTALDRLRPLWKSGAAPAIAIVSTGAGKVHATEGFITACADHYPTLIVCGGIAGSLDPALNPGDTIIANRCWYYDRDITAVGAPLGAVERGGTDRFDLQYPEELPRRHNLIPGTIATGDSVLTERLRRSLPQRWQERLAESNAVDMESAVWAELGAAKALPVVVVRTIFDTVGYRSADKLSFREATRIAGERLAECAVSLLGG